MQDLWTAILYGVPAMVLSLGLAIWVERLVENALTHNRASHVSDIASSATFGNDNSPMADVSFRCPVTGKNIHHLLKDKKPLVQGTNYKSVDCPACLRLHFIVKSTGQLVKVEKSPPIVPVI